VIAVFGEMFKLPPLPEGFYYFDILETCHASKNLWSWKILQVLNFARKSESGQRPVGPASSLYFFSLIMKKNVCPLFEFVEVEETKARHLLLKH